MSQPSIKLTNGTLDVNVLNSTPGTGENGLVVRNIPTGTQQVTLQPGHGLSTDATLTNGNALVKITDGTHNVVVTNTAPASSDYALAVRVIDAGSSTASYKNIATLSTSTVKASAGILARITLNSAGDTGNIATIYDGDAGTGTKIATINLASAPATLHYQIAFATKLTVITSGGTTCGDLTVMYS